MVDRSVAPTPVSDELSPLFTTLVSQRAAHTSGSFQVNSDTTLLLQLSPLTGRVRALEIDLAGLRLSHSLLVASFTAAPADPPAPP